MSFLKAIISSLSVLLILLAASSCSHNDRIPPGDLKKVIWDLAVADEFAGYYIRIDTVRNLDSATNALYYRVLTMHGFTREEFNKSMHWYDNHPNEYQELIDSVTSYGNRMRDESYEKRSDSRPQRVLSDSLLH